MTEKMRKFQVSSTQEKFERVWPYMEKLLWVLAAGFFYEFYGIKNILQHPGLKYNYFKLSLILISACFPTFLGLDIYLKFIKKSKIDISEAFPWSIPLVTVTFLIATGLFNFSLWRCFKFMTPVISFT